MSMTCSRRSAYSSSSKRCLEGLDQLMRQLADKADRVGDHDIQRVGHREKARRRVQRVKQAVIRGNARAGQRVQKRRLARVRVADDGDDGNFILAAAVALRGAHAAHLFKVRLQLVDLSVDVAAVGLKLRFAGALRADGSLCPTCPPGAPGASTYRSGAAAGTDTAQARPEAGPLLSSPAGRRYRE